VGRREIGRASRSEIQIVNHQSQIANLFPRFGLVLPLATAVYSARPMLSGTRSEAPGRKFPSPLQGGKPMAHQTRPLIGINADFVAAAKQTRACVRVHAGYYEAVLNAGGMPLIVPPLCKDISLDALLDRLDGFVLTGGLDMDPRKLGLPPHSAVQPMA